MGLGEKKSTWASCRFGFCFFFFSVKTFRIDNRQADVFSCFYSENHTADRTLRGRRKGRKGDDCFVHTDVLWSGSKKTVGVGGYFWGCFPLYDYENILAEKFVLCCSDQEEPGPQHQMQVRLLSSRFGTSIKGQVVKHVD